jgi:cytochrome d ubiquinol oxidase subunit II
MPVSPWHQFMSPVKYSLLDLAINLSEILMGEMMDLNTICFLLFGFLFIGFLVLEGFDYGVGMLLPFLGESDIERQAIINTLAPVWEGNEVWLIAAGTVLFASFPHVYATLFSGLYLALLLILTSLILRGVAFAFRNKDTYQNWRSFWDWAIFCGGVIPALLWGIAVADLLNGLPINGEMQYIGTFGDLISLYTLTGGLAFALMFVLHGAAYLTLKLDQQFTLRARKTGLSAGKYAVLAVGGFAILTFIYTDLAAKPIAGGILVVSVMALALCCRCLRKHQYVKSFVLSTVAIISSTSAIFLALFPRFIISSLDPNWSLSIYNSASNPLTLKIMTVTVVIMMPIVLGLEGWKYHIFSQRISVAEIGFAARRKLWEQLRGRLKEQIGYYYNLSIILEKAKYTLKRGRSLQASETTHASTLNQLNKFKILIRHGRQLVDVICKMIKMLRK